MLLKEILQQKVLVQDGAMGTLLEALVPPDHPLSVKGLPLWSTKVLLAKPAWVTQVHKSYVDAGCDMLITATYQASKLTLQTHAKLDSEGVAQVWQQAVDCAKDAIAGCKRKVYIAASIGPYGAWLANGSEYTGNYSGLLPSELGEYHRDMVQYYVDHPDVDLLAFETVPNFDEVKGILALMHDLTTPTQGKPFYIALSCTSENTLVDGTPLRDVVEYLAANTVGVVGDYFLGTGCNCLAFELVSGIVATINNACEALGVPPIPLVVYPNLGFANDMSDPSQWAFNTNTAGWRQAVVDWLSVPNVRVIGGCCSTGPEEIKTIKSALQ